MSLGRRPNIRVHDEWAIRKALTGALAVSSAERAFRALADGDADVPPPMGAAFRHIFGEIHMKGAHLKGSPYFVFKFATGFYSNVEMGVPTGSGLMLLFEAETGFPRGILFDNGYLTDLRTAAAGALAARLLTPNRPLRVGVLGAGVQGRMQIQAVAGCRRISEVHVWSPRNGSRRAYVEKMGKALGVAVHAHETPAGAVKDADLVITATPSRRPLLLQEHVRPGVTIIALGADGPEKRELDPALVARAKIVTDLTSQCERLGELHHAIAAGLTHVDGVHAELGQILIEERPGRESEDEVIVCDLTGVGAQDAAIAEAAFEALAPEEEEEEAASPSPWR